MEQNFQIKYLLKKRNKNLIRYFRKMYLLELDGGSKF